MLRKLIVLLVLCTLSTHAMKQLVQQQKAAYPKTSQAVLVGMGVLVVGEVWHVVYKGWLHYKKWVMRKRCIATKSEKDNKEYESLSSACISQPGRTKYSRCVGYALVSAGLLGCARAHVPAGSFKHFMQEQYAVRPIRTSVAGTFTCGALAVLVACDIIPRLLAKGAKIMEDHCHAESFHAERQYCVQNSGKGYDSSAFFQDEVKWQDRTRKLSFYLDMTEFWRRVFWLSAAAGLSYFGAVRWWDRA